MTIFTGIVLYIILYWLAIFAVLPFGHKQTENVVVGNVHSAPDNPDLPRKFAITAIVAAVLWLIVFGLIKLDVIDFYDIAQQMADEDHRR